MKYFNLYYLSFPCIVVLLLRRDLNGEFGRRQGGRRYPFPWCSFLIRSCGRGGIGRLFLLMGGGKIRLLHLCFLYTGCGTAFPLHRALYRRCANVWQLGPGSLGCGGTRSPLYGGARSAEIWKVAFRPSYYWSSFWEGLGGVLVSHKKGVLLFLIRQK